MQDRLIRERIEGSKKSILLLGARQVGKSTLAQSLKPDRFLNLMDESEYLRYSKDPALLIRECQEMKSAFLCVIDEIQRVPKLLNSVQVILDSPNNKGRFILTGSSARKLKELGVNLLPGRIIREYLDPLSILELPQPLDLYRALQLGTLPGIYLDRQEGAEVLDSYTEIYLREEIRSQALAKDLGSYARFLDVIALMSGCWLNYSKISSDTEIPKETVRRYVMLLEDTLLAFRLPSFKPKQNIGRRISQRDKIFLFDIGVRNSLLGIQKQKLSAEQIGYLFEHWFILQVMYLNRSLRKNWHLSSYLSAGGAEVDLVVEREADIIGIEVKSGKNVRSSQCTGLISLGDLIGKKKKYQKWIAYCGEHRQKFPDGSIAMPYIEALNELVV